MPEVYLQLSQKEQAQILRALSTKKEINRDSILLEKDIWICWALEHLFKMPNRLPMAFKGGTSLSKVFKAIDRFSEDVDVTIDYKAFNCVDPFEKDISKTKLKNISTQIKSMVTQHLQNIVIPYYEKTISEQFTVNAPHIELDDDGETIHLRYPSVQNTKSSYVIDSVRLEFGGRNLITPNNTYTITTEISAHLTDLEFPVAHITVLSPEKTFWEKITLIHYESNRPTFKEDANRISRHWYDVAMLSTLDIGIKAINDSELFKEVIKIKKIFYDSSFAKYDDCLLGKLRLVPNDGYLKLLKHDFEKMLSNKMFYGEQPNFDSIIGQLGQLEKQINEVILQV